MEGFDATPVLDALGDGGAAALAGLLTGAIFGVSAQRSRFCLRAACVEFARGQVGERLSVWFLCFATAMIWTHAFDLLGWADIHASRILTGAGSLSGAIVGGALVGWGMVLSRGCPGRLLVLASTGNLRSLLTGLVFVVAAQMAYHGALAPLRQDIALWWTTGTSNVDLALVSGLGRWTGLVLGVAFTALALWSAARNRVSARTLWFGSGVGFSVGAGWLLTAQLSRAAFEPIPVESIAFSGPSAETLMALLFTGEWADFGVGLVAGVVLGAGIAARAAGEWRFEGFDGAPAMRRHIAGAVLMGFGAMLAGGCSIGAGVTGASTLALSMWVALTAMWVAAIATEWALDRPGAAPVAAQ
ncbi:YeeE/YedE family protein [Rubrimonas sp.]|uniref:YeeE/YedE family protein n=1 Tax=Rubrimonas sp. TaxID=2036015 RepID=UPI002FDDC8AE